MMLERFETYDYDVLIVGAGGAGLRAAIAASAAGARVGLVTKSLLGKAHTVMAEGGIAAALGNVDPADNWQVHFCDTMRGGQMINNWRMVELFAKEAPERVYELERWGALFDRTPEGKILQRPFGAHTWRRLCHVGDRTGLEMIRTLQDRGVHQGMDVHMEVTLTRLLKDGGRIAGAFGYRREDGRFVVFRARAIVLATGGWGRVYKVTSNSWECTGDGAAMAYEAGAELMDMEMVQFHPTGMVWPPGVRGILVTEGVRGEGGILLNNRGERFMERYDPVKKELSSRDVVARAIYQEVQEGRGTEHGGVYLDITHRGAEYIKRKLPSMYDQFLSLADVDITREKMEVAPTIHYVMGGVRVEPETGASTVPGLFAAGEVAAGLHGANRLGGNSLSDLLVFGKRAGDAAAAYANQLGVNLQINPEEVEAESRRLLRPFESDGNENPYLLHEALQETMQNYVGIARTGEQLQHALEEILRLQERAQRIRVSGSRLFNPGWHTAIDVQFMLTVCEAIIRSAIERRESRGSHWRLDYPKQDPELGRVNFVVRKTPSGMEVTTSPIPPLREDLAALLAAK
ncbi:MAG TPA: FAD-binding protein [Chloroflexota bacterium]|nr:FAD-binding protein [Chloroflexota bacterium]